MITERRTRFGVALGALLATISAVAADQACEPEPVQAWPTCHPKAMLATINPRFTLDVFGNLNPAAFEGGANSELLPGQGHLRVGGRVSGSGAGCARHLAAKARESGGAGEGLSPEIAARIEAMTGESLPSADTSQRNAVIQVFSPNIVALQAGAPTGEAKATRHHGVGGWPENAAANVTLEMVDTSPGDLQAGGTYTARVISPVLYTDWTGHHQPVHYDMPLSPEDSATVAGCKRGRDNMLELLRFAGVPLGSTRGRELREMDCYVNSFKFTGTKRRVTSTDELQAEVAIAHITEAKVVGTFRVEGEASVQVRTCRAQPRPGHGRCTEDNEDELVSLSGSFHAPNIRDSGFVVPGSLYAASASPDGTAGASALEVVGHTPRRDRRNVDWEQPGIRVQLSAAVDPESVNAANVEVGYHGLRSFVPIDGDVGLTDRDTVAFTPAQPLKDGVRYHVRLKAGGLRGLNGQGLATRYEWPFYTTVFLGYSDEDPAGTGHPRLAAMPDLGDHLDKREGIEAHVFQVSRNERLVPGKPTLTRVYAKWRKHDEVSEYDTVNRMEAHVRLRGGDDLLIYPPRNRVWLERYAEYTNKDIQNADNSVNIARGWRARGRQPRELIAEIEPVDQCGEPRQFRSEPRPLDYTQRAPRLDIDVYLFQRQWLAAAARAAGTGDADRIAADNAVVRDIGPPIAYEGAAFTTQNFPVRNTRIHYKGLISASEGFLPMAKGDRDTRFSGLFDQEQVDQVLMQSIRDQLAAAGGTDSDAVMVLFPPGIQPRYGGYAYSKHPETGLIGLFLKRGTSSLSRQDRIDLGINTVAHELGHVYGLGHSPRKSQGPDREADQAGVPPIEGFRLRDSGTGWNKSEEEGNEELGHGRMYALMARDEVPYKGSFIARRSYRALLPRLTAGLSDPGTLPRLARGSEPGEHGMRGYRPGGFRIMRAQAMSSLAASPVAAAAAAGGGGEHSWRVSGAVLADGDGALINRVTRVSGGAVRSGGAGPFRAVLLDRAGNELAARSFAVPSPSLSDADRNVRARLFRVALPFNEAAARLVIERDGERLASRERSRKAPEIEVNAPRTTDAGVVLSWTAADPDSDAVAVDVDYSPDGHRFIPVAGGLVGDRITLPPAALTPGASPMLRLRVTDGFNHASTIVPVALGTGLATLAVGPKGAVAETRPTLFALLNAAPDRDATELVLTGDDGTTVATTLHRGDSPQALVFRPESGLTPATTYTARLSRAEDAHGNRLAEPVEWRFRIVPSATAAE